MGEKGEVLRDVRDLPSLRRKVPDLPLTYPDPPSPGFLESHDRFENQCLSTPCRAEKEMKLAFLNLDIEIHDLEGIEMESETFNPNHTGIAFPSIELRKGCPSQEWTG